MLGSYTFKAIYNVDVTAVKIVKSIGVGAKIIKATAKAAKDKLKSVGNAASSANNLNNMTNDLSNIEINSAEDLENLQNTQQNVANELENLEKATEDIQSAGNDLGKEILAILDTPDGRETMLIALSIATTVSSGFDMGNLTGAGLLASILTMLITLIALIALLVLTFVIPIMLVASTISALFFALTNLSTPEEVAVKISRKLPGFITLPFTMMLFQCVVPGMTYGKGIVGVCIVTVISAVLGLVVSRLRSYEAPAFRYLNIVQGISIVGIVGFLLFFFNLVQTGILNTFLRGNFADYISRVALILAPFVEHNLPLPDINTAFVVDLVLILFYVSLALGSVGYLEKCVQRLACSAVANKKGVIAKDTAIVQAILLIAVYAIPTYIMGLKHFFENPLDVESKVGDASLLVLNTDQKAALNMALVGIALMLVAEVALIVLKGVFCKGMNKTAIDAIMTGAEASAEATEATETTEATEAIETVEADETAEATEIAEDAETETEINADASDVEEAPAEEQAEESSVETV